MAYEFDDDIVSRYLNADDKTKTDALFDKINDSSRARSGRKHSAPVKQIEFASKEASKEKQPNLPKKKKKVSQYDETADVVLQAEETPKENNLDIASEGTSEESNSTCYSVLDRAKEIESLKKQQVQKKLKTKRTWQAIGLSVGSFFTVLVVGIILIAYSYIGGLKINKIDENKLGVNSDIFSNEEGIDPHLTKITNIALFGVDAREGEEDSRSDAIMIMSINPMNGKTKLISVLRDSYVDMDGEGWWDKITHAYYYGGPEMAIRVLNTNFGLNITDYVTVDFGSMADAIDALGGVYVDVDEDEIYHVNINMNEINPNYTPLYDTGTVLLNGEQAVGYARIRAIDGDQARSGRQREVVMAAVDRVKNMEISSLPKLAKTIIPMIETSMSYSEIISYIPMLKNDITLEQAMIPGKYDGAYDKIVDGIYYMGYDLEAASQHIYDFIYKDIHPDTDPALLAPATEESDTYDEYTTTE